MYMLADKLHKSTEIPKICFTIPPERSLVFNCKIACPVHLWLAKKTNLREPYKKCLCKENKCWSDL